MWYKVTSNKVVASCDRSVGNKNHNQSAKNHNFKIFCCQLKPCCSSREKAFFGQLKKANLMQQHENSVVQADLTLHKN